MNPKSSISVSAVVLLFVLTVTGVFAGLSQNNFQISVESSTPQVNYQSKSSLESKIQNFVYFYSTVFLDRSKTKVTIPYSYDTPQAPILFLGFAPDSASTKIEFLFSHPAINQLTWDRKKSGDVSLYQKRPTYASVSEFINDLPEPDVIVVDPTLKDDYPNLKGLATTEDPIDLDRTEFILTKYLDSFESNGVYYLQDTIDASTATLNDKNQIEWFVRAPQASSEQPYLLGHISVDYLQ